MAARVYGDAGIPVNEKNARTLAEWIVRTKPESINVSKVRDGAHLVGLRETQDVKNACQYLVEAFWLLEPSKSGKAGRPAGTYPVNPKLWEVLAN
jgi:putative DNA primase/helicase